jgi:hypothetical protein
MQKLHKGDNQTITSRVIESLGFSSPALQSFQPVAVSITRFVIIDDYTQ